MAAHACLKNEFTKDEKYHNLMTWLKYSKYWASQIIAVTVLNFE